MRTVIAALWLLAVPALAAGESAAEISRKSREKGALNLTGLTAQLKLVTTSKDGKVKEQVLSSSARQVGGKSASIARFSQPAGVAGVAVLTVEGSGGEADDIALYLPKLKRVRKVAKSDRGKAFMDTDFAYADIAGNGGSRDDQLKRLADEKQLDRPCYVLEGPGGEDTPYGTVKVWIDQQTFVPMQVTYSDKSGAPLKKYRTLSLKAFKERTVAAESVMENLQTGSKTQMTVLSLEDCALGEDAFTERALERG